MRVASTRLRWSGVEVRTQYVHKLRASVRCYGEMVEFVRQILVFLQSYGGFGMGRVEGFMPHKTYAAFALC